MKAIAVRLLLSVVAMTASGCAGTAISLEKVTLELSETRQFDFKYIESSGTEFALELSPTKWGDARFNIYLDVGNYSWSHFSIYFDDTCGVYMNGSLSIGADGGYTTTYFDEFATNLQPVQVSIRSLGKYNGRWRYEVRAGSILEVIYLERKLTRIKFQEKRGRVSITEIRRGVTL